MKGYLKLLIAFVIAIAMFGVVMAGCSSNKPDYRAKSNKALTSYYETVSSKAGVGVPVIDEGVADYAEWTHTDDKFTMTKSTYTLGGVKIKHSYTMTWRTKTGELVKMVIDGKKVMYNEDLMWKALDDK